MTPQLQQAIRLLQLSSLELQVEVQEALESNPMLDVEEETENAADQDWDVQKGGATEQQSTELPSERQQDNAVDMESAVMPDELPVDSSWEDTYDSAVATSFSSGAAATEADDSWQERLGSAEQTLIEQLLWQMRLMSLTDIDRVIAEVIIDSIDDKGYLAAPLEEIHQGLAEEHDIDFDEVEAVLHLVQTFEPAGIGARDLAECLLIQLRQMDKETPWRSAAIKLIRSHMKLLANRDYRQLMNRMKLSEDELCQLITFIQTLNPRPGSGISSGRSEYVIPDVIVKKVKGAWRVELNGDAMPRLRVNPQYANLVRRADNSTDNTYMKGQLQEARWFLKSLKSRSETLLKVATCIVERQRGFLEQGEEAMKALVLHDIAEKVGMHESTISRVTTQKYMHTPRGIFELKYFFSSHVSMGSGEECSSTAIRAQIKKLVAAEDPRKPLSDSKLAAVLGERDIKIARRTVAKYRESLAIPPFNERKRLV